MRWKTVLALVRKSIVEGQAVRWASSGCRHVMSIDFVDDSDVVRSTHACFNSVLEISCKTTDSDNRLLAFDSARYGRNDSRVATQCDVPFSWNCDVDVQFLLNRACAGRRRCSMDVGVKRFTDPCGYAEFLVVSYRCVPGPSIYTFSTPQARSVPTDRTFIKEKLVTFNCFKSMKTMSRIFFEETIIWYKSADRQLQNCRPIRRLVFERMSFFDNDDPYWHKTQQKSCTWSSRVCVQNFAVVRRGV